jgi:hypothetical protein
MSFPQSKVDLESSINQTETLSTHEDLKTGHDVDFERGQLLASLGDPDAAKSEEERAAIDKKLMWKVDLYIVPWLSFL